MRILEVRRHSMRHKPGVHLTQAGVSLARHVGEGMGRFDRVVTSTLARAYETAIAMGYAVDEQRESFDSIPDAATEGLIYPATFEYFVKQAHQHPALVAWARHHANEWLEIIEGIPEGGAALIVSHGMMIEVGIGMLMPALAYHQWGDELNYCEGVRFTYQQGVFTQAICLRVEGMDK